jgi:hypothetical protein
MVAGPPVRLKDASISLKRSELLRRFCHRDTKTSTNGGALARAAQPWCIAVSTRAPDDRARATRRDTNQSAKQIRSAGSKTSGGRAMTVHVNVEKVQIRRGHRAPFRENERQSVRLRHRSAALRSRVKATSARWRRTALECDSLSASAAFAGTAGESCATGDLFGSA